MRSSFVLAPFCLVLACSSTKSELVRCDTDPECGPGFRCDIQSHVCVCSGTSFPGCNKFVDARPAVADGQESVVEVATGFDAEEESVAAPDASVDTAADAAVDGPGCKVNGDCQAGRPVCTAGVCVECSVAGDCKDPARAFCVGNACVGCDQAGASACAGMVCAPASTVGVGGQCVQCLTSATCAAVTPICAANVCTACTASSQCAARSSTTPACSASGTCVQCTDNGTCSGATPVCDTTTNQCVQCVSSGTCPAATPICMADVCTACSTGSQCAAKNSSTPACSATGTCVQCIDNNTCSGATPVCDPTTNKCVQCLTSAGCSGATPICTANVCTACTSVADGTLLRSSGGTASRRSANRRSGTATCLSTPPK